MLSSFGRFVAPPTIALVAVLALLVILVPAVGAIVAAKTRALEDTPARKRARYARTMLVLWTMTALAIYALSLHGESLADVGFHPPNSLLWYLAGPVLVAVLLTASGAGRGDVSESYARAVRIVVPRDAFEWAWFVPVAATAALCEEFLYRGYALTQVAGLTGSVAAGVVVSSIAFGLAHAYQGRIGMAGTALTGILYAAMFVAGGSLWPCMIAHFLQDIVGAALLSRRMR
jgi:membrane protease YdiL (CAAX protease family)